MKAAECGHTRRLKRTYGHWLRPKLISNSTPPQKDPGHNYCSCFLVDSRLKCPKALVVCWPSLCRMKKQTFFIPCYSPSCAIANKCVNKNIPWPWKTNSLLPSSNFCANTRPLRKLQRSHFQTCRWHRGTSSSVHPWHTLLLICYENMLCIAWKLSSSSHFLPQFLFCFLSPLLFTFMPLEEVFGPSWQ